MASMNKKDGPRSGPHLYKYGVTGLTEWQAVIAAGNARIRIPFTGGMMTGYGCVPAMFVTESAAIAKIIEKSEYFLTRRIRRID